VFLFQALAKELQAGRDATAFARYSSAADVMAAFRSQFEAYTRQYPPFSVRSNTWSKAIQYWPSLEELPEASISAIPTLTNAPFEVYCDKGVLDTLKFNA
jgi:hypothetical protein